MWTNLRLLAGPELVANIHVVISLIKSYNAEHGQTFSGESSLIFEQLDARATPDVNFFLKGFVNTWWQPLCGPRSVNTSHSAHHTFAACGIQMCISKMSFTPLAQAPIIAITKATTKIYNYELQLFLEV